MIKILLILSITICLSFTQTCKIVGCDADLKKQTNTGTNFMCHQITASKWAEATCPDENYICSTFNKDPKEINT